jgi:mediator of RNA polymerase II transcription subunit 12, fungi type
MVCTFIFLKIPFAKRDTESIHGTKAAEPFSFYPTVVISELLEDMPGECLRKIRQLLPFPDPHPGVQDLASAVVDDSGEIMPGQPIQHRPWEWTEYLGEAAMGDNEQPSIRRLVGNTAALSLDSFDITGTGERLPISIEGVDIVTWRTFHDNASSESVFVRSWLDRRTAGNDVAGPPPRSAQDVDMPDAPTWVTAGHPVPAVQSRPGSRGTSPASSVQSRGSLILPGGIRASPGATRGGTTPQSTGTPTGARRASKRKAPQALDVDEDDEIQIIDQPSASSSQRAKPKPRPVGKAKAQLR